MKEEARSIPKSGAIETVIVTGGKFEQGLKLRGHPSKYGLDQLDG